jgi:protease I
MKFMNKNLKGRKIAVLMADGFEMAEYTVPVNALRMSGASITVISLRHGRIRGVNLHEPAHRVSVDLSIDEAMAADFDALFIPGGFINPDLLRQSEQARTFVRSFDLAKKPIASLCHGPWVLGSSGLLEGRTLSSWPGIRDDVVNAGGIWVDQPVVRDGNLLTSRGPQDFAEFVPALLAFFAEPASEMASRTVGTQATSSPQRTQAPAVMLGTMRWMPRPSFRGFALGALLGGGLAMMMQGRRLRSTQAMRSPVRSPWVEEDFTVSTATYM